MTTSPSDPTTVTRRPGVAVIIPTFHDWPQLARCLEALESQSLPAGDFETLVIDNAADGEPPADLPHHLCRIHKWSEGHSYSARNAGARLAKAPILAFTDADCVPSRDWLAAALDTFRRDPAIAMVAGGIRMQVTRPTLWALFDELVGIPQEAFVRELGGAATANLFVRRTVFEQMGGFRDELESGGDLEFCRRAVATGHRLVYAGDAEVVHPTRETAAAIFKKSARVARGRAQLYALDVGRYRASLTVTLLRPFRPPWRFWRRILARRGLAWHRRAALVALAAAILLHQGIAQGAAVLRLRRNPTEPPV